MNEREQSRMVANMWLDGRMNSLTQMVPGDPDCDACALARSYLRALEKIERMKAILRIMANGVWNDHIAVQAALAAIHHLRRYGLQK